MRRDQLLIDLLACGCGRVPHKAQGIKAVLQYLALRPEVNVNA